MNTYSNTGHRNTGNWNTGERNTGHSNTGNWNTGNWNTGNWNTGNRNTGNWNTGNRNTGHRNTGHSNTGNWNTGHRNTGYFNTDTPPLRMFNRDTNVRCEDIQWPDFLLFTLTKWIESSTMTEAEKTKHPSHVTTGGYLKTYEYKEAFRKAWDSATDEDKKKLFALPNFDAAIFKEISGIDVSENANRKQSLMAKADELIAKANELKAEADCL